MNVWYRHVISVKIEENSEIDYLRTRDRITNAIKTAIGSGGPLDQILDTRAHKDGYGYTFDTQSEDPLQEGDEDRIRKVIIDANRRPCAIRIQEHHVEESDPSTKEWAEDGLLKYREA